jgi:hypothetical protein
MIIMTKSLTKNYGLLLFLSLFTYINSAVEVEREKSTLKYKDNETKTIDYKYYENFNLTQELEKQYQEKGSKYYEDVEQVKATYGKKEKKDKIAEREMKEWEQKTANFNPDIILTSLLPKGGFEVFYDDIQKIPSKVQIAFYINDEESKIDFEAFSPRKTKITLIRNKNRGYYEFTANMAGVYEFHISNERYKTIKKVTFAIHSEANIEHSMDTDTLSEMDKKVNAVESKMNEFYVNKKMEMRKYEGHFELSRQHNSSIMTYSLLETIIMIVILVVQLYYLRSIFNKHAH